MGSKQLLLTDEIHPNGVFQANFRVKVNLRAGGESPGAFVRFDKHFQMCSRSQVKDLLCAWPGSTRTTPW